MSHHILLVLLTSSIVAALACAAPATEPQVLPPPAKEANPTDRNPLAAIRQMVPVLANSERDEMVAFTRQALAIEAERNALMGYFAGLEQRFGPLGSRQQVNRWILPGISERQAEIWKVPDTFDGLYFLQTHLLLLDAPQSLEPVKDSLAQVYASEIQLASNQSQSSNISSSIDEAVALLDEGALYPRIKPSTTFVIPQITKDNVAARQSSLRPGYRLGHWGQTQLFRKQIYTRWAEILREHDIDPAEEGFTQLVIE